MVDKNPVDGLKRRKLRRKPVAVYSPEQVQVLLHSAWEHDREMVPFFAILIFAGLRPDEDSEIGKLNWEDVNFQERWIRVGARFDNKTESKRFVPIEDNLLA
jgi:integrase